MTKQVRTVDKLRGRCEILEKLVISISETYLAETTDDDQKRFIETILGAAIWYLPHNNKYWTGKISENAKESLSKDCKAKLTKEHQFPRKIAAKELLNGNKQFDNNENCLLKLYEEKYAKYNLVTPQENRKISKNQRDKVFKNIEKAYEDTKIKLVEITENQFKSLRKGIKIIESNQ
jgi:hypothetical protein